MRYATQNCPIEWSYTSGKQYDDPFNAVEVNLHLSDPEGREVVVPAYWAGDQTWRVRFAPRRPGRHTIRTVCTDPSNPDLHGQTDEVDVEEYRGTNPLFRHGPLRPSADRRYLEHADGTPFLWLADTWWMGLCKRLTWPDEFRRLLADRVSKGFSVVQIVAGLYPDMPAFDPRGANEAGFPWDRDFHRINPAYFDQADLRIAALVEAGIVPCLVGCWGYFVAWMGIERMRRHWRYLVARYNAYPVIWCLAGEATMPYYLSENRERDRELQRQAWTQLAAYVRAIDPGHHPITVHPTSPASARDQLASPAKLDLDLLQTGHADRESLKPTLETIRRAVAQEPRLPVINGEVCYEGIAEASRQEVQRMMFWACVLNGACGHTYGANGIWQLNRRGQPYGPSPHGFSWGNTPWEEAYQLPGSTQVGLGKRLLERYRWWRFEPHPEWVDPHFTTDIYALPYAAGIPGEVRLIYFPPATSYLWRRGEGFQAVGLAPGKNHAAFFWDPTNGDEYPLEPFTADARGAWRIPHPPIFQDWVLVIIPRPGTVAQEN